MQNKYSTFIVCFSPLDGGSIRHEQFLVPLFFSQAYADFTLFKVENGATTSLWNVY